MANMPMANMAASVCPTCNSPIDPARAPVARVRGARIITYCSTPCADAPDTVVPSPSAPASDKPGADRAASVLERAVEPAEPSFAPPRPRGNRKRKIIALSAAIMAGGMAITIINAVSPSTPSDVSAAEGPRSAAIQGNPGEGLQQSTGAAAEAATDKGRQAGPAAGNAGGEEAREAPLDPSPDALLARAGAALREFMDSPSPRIQRIAAMALSRTGDREAIARLQKLLDEETVELRKVDIAYALARAGDSKAQKLLRRRLKHKHRDVRVDAARSLVQLGDDAGEEVLRQVLGLRSHRIGAAGLLARLGQQRGVAALHKELDDAGASEETKMRAAVALGRAGDASVRDRLVAMLSDTDRRFHVGAADALAALGDREAALPALTRQLALPSLRVRAALALRRLGADVDLEILATALAKGSDPARVSAAEAILILTGPKRLAERD